MKIFALLLSSPLAMASPLTDWFADSEAEIPGITQSLTKEEAQKKRREVWQAYRDNAKAGRWAEQFPVKDGGMEAWVKEKQIQPLIADLGEKKMPYVIARMADDGGPLGRLLRDGSCRTSQ
jgi:hypothetical protein